MGLLRRRQAGLQHRHQVRRLRDWCGIRLRRIRLSSLACVNQCLDCVRIAVGIECHVIEPQRGLVHQLRHQRDVIDLAYIRDLVVARHVQRVANRDNLLTPVEHYLADGPAATQRITELGLHAHSRCAENLGHRVARSTIARILEDQGIPPSRERPMAWRTFLRAHGPALVAADFFTTEVWTARGLVSDYTAFVIELHSRRVQIVGSTSHPDEAFVMQRMRHLTDPIDGVLSGGRVLLCDRDRKWSQGVQRFLETADVRVIRTP